MKHWLLLLLLALLTKQPALANTHLSGNFKDLLRLAVASSEPVEMNISGALSTILGPQLKAGLRARARRLEKLPGDCARFGIELRLASEPLDKILARIDLNLCADLRPPAAAIDLGQVARGLLER